MKKNQATEQTAESIDQKLVKARSRSYMIRRWIETIAELLK